MILALLITGGCATYQPRPISASAKAAAFEARSLESPALRSFLETNLGHDLRPWPPKAWDATLLVLAARFYHPELDQARARLKTAEASVITMGARPNPSFTFTPEFSANPPSGVSPWIVGAVLDLPIETAGKRGYRLVRGSYLAQAARFEVAAAEWQVEGKVTAALLGLSAARDNIMIQAKRVQVLEELALLFRRRQSAGEVSAIEVTNARMPLARARLRLQTMQGRESEARADLAASLGLPASALERVSIATVAWHEVPSLPAFSVPDPRRTALLGRPDLLASLARYHAADASLRLELAKQYPDLRVGPGYQWDQGQNKWMLGLSLTLPLFNRNEGPIAEAEARREEAEADFVALQAGIIGEIDRAQTAVSAASSQAASIEGAMSLQQSQLDAQLALFRAGEIDRAAWLTARLDYLDAELSRLSALIDLKQALTRLEHALYYRGKASRN